MNNTRRNRAIKQVEHTAQYLIGKAEVVNVGDSEWSRVTHREGLLEAAREYAAAVLNLARLPA